VILPAVWRLCGALWEPRRAEVTVLDHRHYIALWAVTEFPSHNWWPAYWLAMFRPFGRPKHWVVPSRSCPGCGAVIYGKGRCGCEP